jgi:XTP/dITP diphosphohydrolase
MQRQILGVHLLIASNNRAKVGEIRAMLEPSEPDAGADRRRAPRLNVLSLAEAGVVADVAETGATFAENARLKARAVRALLAGGERAVPPAHTASPASAARTAPAVFAANTVVLADDSGLCVDYLDGAPGVLSARYAGAGATDSERIAKLLDAMKDARDAERAARFVCVMILIFPDEREIMVEGVWEGRIARAPSGANGFGYDPVFYVPALGRTAAELPPELKNGVSHRGRAILGAADALKRYMAAGGAQKA